MLFRYFLQVPSDDGLRQSNLIYMLRSGISSCSDPSRRWRYLFYVLSNTQVHLPVSGLIYSDIKSCTLTHNGTLGTSIFFDTECFTTEWPDLNSLGQKEHCLPVDYRFQSPRSTDHRPICGNVAREGAFSVSGFMCRLLASGTPGYLGLLIGTQITEAVCMPKVPFVSPATPQSTIAWIQNPLQ